MSNYNAWPALPLAQWRETCETVHMYSQIIGKMRLALSPNEPEWAHVTLYVTPRGLTTGPIPFRERSFQVDFDFVDHKLDIAVSDGQVRSIPLVARSVAEFYRLVLDALREMQIAVRLWPMPVEVPNPIRFDRDEAHASYDSQAVDRLRRVLVSVDASLKEHRAPFRRRHTPVQFFWGTFDLSYARFSGRPATPPANDVMTKNAMDAQEICAGFWPGDDRFAEPAFWCYAFPKPPGAEQLTVRPSTAFWSDQMGEFVLRYEDVRTSNSPHDTLREFLTSTFEELSNLAKWDGT